jgi:Zn-finger nucleic acid-binding protein
VRGESFLCHCGARVANRPGTAVDAPVRRCSACGAGVSAGAEKCAFCGSVVGAGAGRLICPECFARNQGQARFCASCGVEFRPQPVISEGEPLPCPVCATDLAPRSLSGLAVQECGTCCGLWVPVANFDALVAHAREHQPPRPTDGLQPTTVERPPPAATVAYRACPACRQLMNRKNFARISGVIVDWCRAHGTWLDVDELERIAAFVAAGGMKRLADQEKEDARAAAALRVLDSVPQTPTTYDDGHPTSLIDVLMSVIT